MRIIRTKSGFKIKVDDEDYEYLNQFTWHIDSTFGQARRRCGKTKIGMHTEIYRIHFPLIRGRIIHIDNDKLNNQKSNLLHASTKIIGHRRKVMKRNTTGYTGVSFAKNANRYRAAITYKGKKLHLGYFNTAEEAALIYNQYSEQMFGNLGFKNVIRSSPNYNNK